MRFTVDDMDTPIQVLCRGKVFRILCCPEMWHPSWWSFMDELAVREAWWQIRPGDVVLDAGADFGSYSLPALALGAARVIAWSPPFKDPTEAVEATTLVRSAIANGWGDRLTVLTSGLWSAQGWLAAFDGPRMAQFFATHEEALACIAGQDGHCATFPVSSLDAAGIQRCDWLKVDTEGAELDILRGGAETIRRCQPKIILENHTHLDPDCEAKCTAFLDSLGYRHVATMPHHTISHSLYVPATQRGEADWL